MQAFSGSWLSGAAISVIAAVVVATLLLGLICLLFRGELRSARERRRMRRALASGEWWRRFERELLEYLAAREGPAGRRGPNR